MILELNSPKAPPRRVDWRSVDDIQAMTMAALGWAVDRIVSETGLTKSQVTYRMKRATIRLRDYRNGVAGTLGGQVANRLMRDVAKTYTHYVGDRLPKLLPTKRETRTRA